MEKEINSQKSEQLTESTIISSKKLEHLTELIDVSSNNISYIQELVDDMENEQYGVITSIIKNNIAPDQEINHKVNKSQKVMRRIGQRFLNLFKITFTVEFAGVTLIHFTIPKVDDNGQVINKTNK